MRRFTCVLLCAVLAAACTPASDIGAPSHSPTPAVAPRPSEPVAVDADASPGDAQAAAPAAEPTDESSPAITASPAPSHGSTPAPAARPAASESSRSEAPPRPGTDDGEPVDYAPAPPGTYTYATDGSMTATGGASRRLPETTTSTVDRAREGRQRTVRDLRDEDGRGQLTETTLEHRDDAVHLSSVRATTDLGGGFTDTREWHADPPGVIAGPDAAPGDRREFTMRGADSTAEVTVEVLRREEVTVGGTAVDALVIRIQIVVSGSLEGRHVTTAWVRPQDLLRLKEEVKGEFTNGALRMETEYRAELEHLQPG